jgi:hypothetical protein
MGHTNYPTADKGMRPILAGIQITQSRRHRRAICLASTNGAEITQTEQKSVKQDEQTEEKKRAIKVMVKSTVVRTYFKIYEAEKSSAQNKMALSNIIAQVCNVVSLPSKHIMSLPAAVSFSDLTVLTVSFAAIGSFRKGMFVAFPYLETLDVSHNNLSDSEIKRTLAELMLPLKILTNRAQNPSQLKLEVQDELPEWPHQLVTNFRNTELGLVVQGLELSEFSQQFYADDKYSHDTTRCVDASSASTEPDSPELEESQVQLQTQILSRRVPGASRFSAASEDFLATPDPAILRQLQAMSGKRGPKGSRRQSICVRFDRPTTPLV